jgi:hypothetical protein
MHDSLPGLSRRSILKYGTAALAAGGAVILGTDRHGNEAWAQAKVKKEAAGYQDSPKGEQRCDNCKNFKPPSSCQLVEGNVSPSGWCKFYAKKA